MARPRGWNPQAGLDEVLGEEKMAVTLKAHTRHTCAWGRRCCDFDAAHGKSVKVTRRRVKRSERQTWKREIRG